MPLRYVDRKAHLGRMSPTLDDLATLFQGTHARPPGRNGDISSQLDGVIPSIIGGFTPTANRTGQIITTLAGSSALLTGSHIGGGLQDGGLADIPWSGAMPEISTGNLVSFGGINGAISQAANGLNIIASVNLGPNFTKPAGDPQFVSPFSYNGMKSIQNRYGYGVASGGTYNPQVNTSIHGIGYVFPQAFLSIYWETFWHITIPSGADGQVKEERITGDPVHNGGLTDDCYANILANQYGSNGSFQLQSTGPGNNGGSLLPNVQYGGDGWVLGGWIRREVWIVPGTANSPNGTISWRFTRLSDGFVLAQNSVTRMLWGGTDQAFRAFILQGLFANAAQQNGSQLFIDTNSKAYARYSSSGFPIHVKFGNAPTYAACDTRLFVTQDTQAAGGGNIRVRAIRGVLGSISPYAYVMGGINTPLNANGIVPIPVAG